jgi:TPR repeat protein
MAQQGNAKAQHLLGVMYHKGEGVKRDSTRAQMWFGVAAKGGDPGAKQDWARLSRELEPKEIEKAREMAQICEASNYRSCDY